MTFLLFPKKHDMAITYVCRSIWWWQDNKHIGYSFLSIIHIYPLKCVGISRSVPSDIKHTALEARSIWYKPPCNNTLSWNFVKYIQPPHLPPSPPNSSTNIYLSIQPSHIRSPKAYPSDLTKTLSRSSTLTSSPCLTSSPKFFNNL